MAQKQQTLAVHLHLYYLEMWPEIRKFLANIGDYPYDLFVTMTCENEDLVKDIKNFHNNTKIWVVENRGYDVGPFIEFLHRIDLNKYDLVMKLHTKNNFIGDGSRINKYIFDRKLWFNTLIRALIGSPQIFERNMCEFAKCPEFGMAGSRYLITSETECFKSVQIQVEKILSELGYPTAPIKFVAGTMFMCRSKLLQPFKEHYTINDFVPTDGKVKDGTLAHALERVLGSFVIANGYKIKGFDRSLLYTCRLNFQAVRRFVYQHKVTNSKYELIKVFKLPVYRRRIL